MIWKRKAESRIRKNPFSVSEFYDFSEFHFPDSVFRFPFPNARFSRILFSMFRFRILFFLFPPVFQITANESS